MKIQEDNAVSVNRHGIIKMLGKFGIPAFKTCGDELFAGTMENDFRDIREKLKFIPQSLPAKRDSQQVVSAG